MTPRSLAAAHLRLGLRRVGSMLDEAVRQQVARAERLARPELTAYGITAEEARCLLDDAGALLETAHVSAAPEAEDAAETSLRDEARRHGAELPLDVLCARFGLTTFERFAVLLCAAAEVDAGYGRLFAFILDDTARRAPSVELLAALGARSLPERLQRRSALSRLGTLRRTGILVGCGTADSELRQELRLADLLFDHLAGDGSDLGLILPEAPQAAASDSRLDRLARALACGEARAVGLWGVRGLGAAAALAAAAGLAFRAWSGEGGLVGLRIALQEAALGKRLLCIEADALADAPQRDAAGLLAAASCRLVLTGAEPWRPPALLAAADYAELELGEADLAARRGLWRAEMPELDAAGADAMAARLRFGREQVRASVRTARTAARLAGDGKPTEHLHAAVAALGSGRSRQFATLVRPQRCGADLVLPPALHAQVLEIAHSFRSWPGVAESWGFARLRSGEGGMKALFTGDPGTGKTLAAEVIAATLGAALLRVELSRVVSKWVGETEKNLDAAFAEAEDSQLVLLFDEADALFGKRGMVETGVDRYANLEVSHLLQRLEAFAGLVILASNLRDNIDPAFTRRFHAILHFPRPQLDERRRLWQLAFPPEAPVDPSIDFEALATLDLTGAGVMGAARAAALMAAQEGADEIGKPHVVRAIARQFRREARLLAPKDLGPYASLLQDAR